MSTSPGVSFPEALRFWLKLGFVSFGGPAGQIAIMHRELVEQKRWISDARFLHALNYCMVLPGPEAQQLATYLGWLMHGPVGGIVAGALFVLPGFLVLIALSWAYVSFGDVPLMQGLFHGIKPAVTAIVVHAAWRLGVKTLKNRWLVLIALAAFVAIAMAKLPFPLVVAAAAAAGWAGSKWAPTVFAASAHTPAATASQTPHTPALIDDNSFTGTHLQWQPMRAIAWLAGGLVLWICTMGAIIAFSGWSSTLADMGWFFTKAALLTFGGAYAVLPYVVQGAVDQFQWVTPRQMIDGLALGETTPGPLIMVVSFVAYLGGVAYEVVPGNALAAGVVAATLVTFFTFLPSFVFILVGAPFIESTRGNLALTGPLTVISAAVVGVIASLAVFFAWHVWLPGAGNGTSPAGGIAGTAMLAGVDVFAVAVTAAAALALIRYRINVIWVILACGLAGMAWVLLLRLANPVA